MVTNLTANFVGLLLVPAIVHVDALKTWQYRVAKMPTKSEMYTKYGHAIYFCEKNRVQTKVVKKNYTIN